MNLSIYLMFSAILFCIAILGILINRKNLILLLMCIELMLLAVSTNFIIYGKLWNDINGQILVLFILTVSASEVAIILAILIKLFKIKHSIDVTNLEKLKG